MNNSLLLEVKSLSKRFGGVKAVSDVSFNVHKKEIKGLIGPNGAGKSTLLNAVSGYEQLTSGSVLFKGVDISSYPPYKIVQSGIARTYQTSQITKTMTVLEGVMLGVHAKVKFGMIDAILSTKRLKENEKIAKEKAREVIEFVGISGKESDLCGNLSYGMSRRLEIGRALATDPELILLDEPVAGLNTLECEDFKELIFKLREKTSVLLVEHNMNVIMALCDNVVVINYGEKVCEGTPSFIQEEPKVIACYLGEEV